MQQLYQKALAIKSAIPHPRIMGIIRECGGKMHMTERQWAEAATDFFEAFKNYDEAGNQRRIQCLKYASLLPSHLFCLFLSDILIVTIYILCDEQSKTVLLRVIEFFLALQRYLVLAKMLMESEVNPFDGQEAKP